MSGQLEGTPPAGWHVGEGFGAVKLKVGAADSQRDVRRALLVREALGPDVRIMLDANQLAGRLSARP